MRSNDQAAGRYAAFLTNRTVGVVGAALPDLAPAAITLGQGFAATAVSFRRAYADSRHRPGPADLHVPVLAAHRPHGSLPVVVVGDASCSTVLNLCQITGDWPGFKQGSSR